MPRRAAASDPSTTAGWVAVASLRNAPSATVPPTVSSSVGSVATTLMPLVRSSGMRSVRRTLTPSTLRVAAADSTGPIRRIIAGAAVGSVASSPNGSLPGATCSRLVPNRSSSASRSARLEAEMPTTATIAAMPIATPSDVSSVRSRRARSPTVPSHRASVNRSRARSMPGPASPGASAPAASVAVVSTAVMRAPSAG